MQVIYIQFYLKLYQLCPGFFKLNFPKRKLYNFVTTLHPDILPTIS